MRAFISVNLDQPLKDSIEKIQKILTPAVSGIRWTRAENCHLTLKFLGDIPVESVPQLQACLRPVGERMRPFVIELGGVGQFPPRGSLSVLWIGCREGAASLSELEKQIRGALENSKVGFDRKPFSAHLTIGRGNRHMKVFFKNPERYQDLALGTLRVESFSLMESVLQPSGPVYTERDRFTLGKAR
ncbi:MAG TPA: RNA 2',3'-cyclic phosphodiesterase [bacterium]|nr:RNA 2',3'-cyclic phosphodiesterase [Candidatus Omnitrophota bacterium]HOJ59496.1 RNA 2',3'-cyclic phosphodiesterase [bacterium]HOL93453.1 RNA 2',3'-cyclic phosphodiesterase [bacterium]HPP02750.1 RNA 2',3'-cyclic phosphodiesterase [bacterium]HXK93662.1 RNA 2',3'-cyclic phosphodiesterase [bacterium]